ncbi:hypothetical protein E5676_scaffold409G001950 [Cucumis melo var. makuwa]|uniref:Uncharacterized protein n=1 Tax=Cucumis melo var. makuwa TaxID=1194695 RepID=A0A5A7UC34_CUCMM|nr:hypothetical protein E6C27_scaffold60G004810 [Cucumis melo var. makuwa]TYK04562.1 hypothetical protein E5676_scaffold409G001950 [Cucumis melo var. makuwa]
MSNIYLHPNFSFQKTKYSTSKKARPSTSAFDRLKMTKDQQQREMKSLKVKSFHEENDDDKIHSRVPSRMKRKLSVDINTEGAASPLFQNVDQRTLLLFDMLQTRIFPCVWPRGSSSSSSHIRESRRLIYVATEDVVISNMLLPRRSSLKYVAAEKIVVLKYGAAEKIIVSIYYNREDRRLKYVAAKKIFVSTKKIVVSNVLQPRRSSSRMCCNREDHHLHLLTCVVIEEIIIFIFSHRGRGIPHLHLQCGKAQKIIIFKVAQPKRSSSSSLMRNDNHLHLKCGHHPYLQCDTVEMIIIFIFNMTKQRRLSSSSSMWRSPSDHHLQCGIDDHSLQWGTHNDQTVILFNGAHTMIIFNAAQSIFIFNATQSSPSPLG